MGLGSGIQDPRSGIRKKPIPDPGSRGKKRHRIPDPDPQHCLVGPLSVFRTVLWIRIRIWIRFGMDLHLHPVRHGSASH
jgi:hypothetical protein